MARKRIVRRKRKMRKGNSREGEAFWTSVEEGGGGR